MAIIIQREGEGAQVVQPAGFREEVNLQRYICDNPGILPINDIKDDVRFAVLDWETPVASGSIDILGVDEEGEIYVIETKLYTNPDKRTVLSQVLDYGAALWSTYQDPEGFIQLLDKRLAQRGEGLEKFLEENFEATDEVLAGIRECIRNGAFKFLILMDQVPQGLKDLILFVNRNSNFSVYAVELEHYDHQGLHIFVPHVFGAEAIKSSPSPTGRKWNEESFFRDLQERTDPTTVAAVRKLYEFSEDKATDILWGRGRQRGSFNPKFVFLGSKAPYTVWSDGGLQFNFWWLATGESAPLGARLRQELKGIRGITSYIPEGGLKSPTIPAQAWVPICDEILGALKRFLDFAERGQAPGEDDPPDQDLQTRPSGAS